MRNKTKNGNVTSDTAQNTTMAESGIGRGLHLENLSISDIKSI